MCDLSKYDTHAMEHQMQSRLSQTRRKNQNQHVCQWRYLPIIEMYTTYQPDGPGPSDYGNFPHCLHPGFDDGKVPRRGIS